MMNIKKNLLLCSIFLILIVSIGMVSASDDIHDVIGDNETSSVSQNDYAGLQAEIDNVSAGGNVSLSDSYAPSQKEIDDYSVVNITKSVNVVGVEDKTVIDAKNKVSVFSVSDAGNVLIKNIKFVNAKGASAVSVSNSNVTFENCIFENCNGGVGSAISVFNDESETLTNIINCSFKNNWADDGAASVGGAVAIMHQGYNAITNIVGCEFTNNSALKGGAVYVSFDNKKSGSQLNIDETIFDDNNLRDDDVYIPSGADIAFDDMMSKKTIKYDVEISNSNFTHSPASGVNPIVESMMVPVKNIALLNSNFINSELFTDCGVLLINGSKIYDSAIIPHHLNYYKNSASAFTIDASNSILELTTIRFDGGKVSDVILNGSQLQKESGENLNIAECVVIEDASIDIEEGSVIIDNTNFTDNEQAITLQEGKLSVKNSNFFGDNGIAARAKDSEFINCTGLDNVTEPVDVAITTGENIVYKSGKYLKIKLTNQNTGEILKNYAVSIKLNNEKYKVVKTYNLTTNAKGLIYLKDVSALKIGEYYPVFSSDNQFLNNYEVAFSVTKIPTTVKAPKVTFKAKKSKYFKVTVKNKSTKKAVKSVKVKIKVYTGKKYKTYTVKTSKKGVAKLNTKSLKKGTHKVVISSGSSIYKISAKSKIVIK